jgi:copper chaperone NosL
VRDRQSRLPGRALLTLAVVLAACGGAPQGPPLVRWGVDECSHCHMILAEERYAAVARDTTGAEARFDDLDCLLRFLADRDAAAWTVWVHDYVGPGWLPAATASYAATAAATPMGSGLLAFATPEAALAAAGDAGPLTWEALRASTRSDAVHDRMSRPHRPETR